MSSKKKLTVMESETKLGLTINFFTPEATPEATPEVKKPVLLGKELKRQLEEEQI